MSKQLDKQIGANIKRIRTARGYTQAILGARMTPEVTKQQICMWENGQASLTLHGLQEVAKALRVHLYELFDPSATEAYNPAEDEGETELLKGYRRISDARSQRIVRALVKDLAKHLTRGKK